MKKLLLLSILLLLTVFSCKKNPTAPPIDELQPGSRDYVWKIDTLSVPPGFDLGTFSIWGNEPNDIWGVNYSFSSRHAIWHYNGNEWSNDPTIRPIYPSCIYGFASDNIWIGNVDGSIWHFNGITWSKEYHLQIDGFGFFIQGIYGTSPNNIYAVGTAMDLDNNYKAVIVHYNGTNWKQVDFPELNRSLVRIAYDSDSKIYLIYGTLFNREYEARLLTFDGKNIKEIDSASYAIQICSAGGITYIQKEKSFYKYSSIGLQKIFDFSNHNFAARLWGNSEKDFFTGNWDGIGHYNGTDLITIFKNKPIGWSITNAFIFEKEAFFMCRTYDGITIVISGRLE
jgi:hypothetical protein